MRDFLFLLTFGTLHLSAILFACGSSSTETIVETQSQPEQPPEPGVSRASPVSVEHDGPLSFDPASFDCGFLPAFAVCSFDTLLHNPTQLFIEIERISQNVSPFAQLGLVADLTGMNRDLPYRMAPDERLRLLFNYRRDDPGDSELGAIYVDYRVGSQRHRLAVMVTVD